MRRFRINEDADVFSLYGHKTGEVYELHRIDPNGDIWLKTDNEYGAWCYNPDNVEEVTTPKPLHKDTDLGYFAGIAFLRGGTIEDAIHTARELIKQLNEERK